MQHADAKDSKDAKPPTQRPTCSLFGQPPFTPSGLARNLALEPFDADDLERRKESLQTYCVAFPRTVHPLQDSTVVVGCDECAHGFSATRSALMCNKGPLCKSEAECTECQLSAFRPEQVVPCDACISSTCGMNGNCQCVW